MEVRVDYQDGRWRSSNFNMPLVTASKQCKKSLPAKRILNTSTDILFRQNVKDAGMRIVRCHQTSVSLLPKVT